MIFLRVLNNLEPKEVFTVFEDISYIPRGSGNETGICEYIEKFALERGLECYMDNKNNILVKKPATKGYEYSDTVVFQGHTDMVCEKNRDTIHNFMTDPLKLKIEGDFITAEGTTLGADNGVAVAYGLAILNSTDISHPPIELLLTSGEEVGMEGALSFDMSNIKGRTLINLDSSDEGILLVSCCGGVKSRISLPLKFESANKGYIPISIKVSGLRGGHSGVDIHLQRANSNNLMGTILYNLSKVYCISMVSVDGGFIDNAICRETETVILVDKGDQNNIENDLRNLKDELRHVYRSSDPDIEISSIVLKKDISAVFTKETEQKVIALLTLMPNGVISKSLEIEKLTETSNNLGIVRTLSEKIEFVNATRSSVKLGKENVCIQLSELAKLTGSDITFSGEYPSWEYNPDSIILKLSKETYRDMYGVDATVEAIHAGLECGIFAENIPGIDIISIGPNMYDIHSPNERLSISSTARVWGFLKEILKRMR